MGRGPTVAVKKEKNAKERAKINTLHAKLITIAAAKGGPADLNTTLSDAIHAAKKANVPLDVIDRAIQRGTGGGKDAAHVEEIFYEGYAPGGIALIIRTLTDNRNRTTSNIRHILSAHGGNLGETGSVSSFLFQYHSYILLEVTENTEQLENDILESGADNYEIQEEGMMIFADATKLHDVLTYFRDRNYAIEESGFLYIPTTSIPLEKDEHGTALYHILDDCGQDDDVEMIWHNADISLDRWKEISKMVESKKFHT